MADTVKMAADDALRVTLADRARRDHLAHHLRQTGTWQEVIPGRADLTVQFDPAFYTPEQAMFRFRNELKAAPTELASVPKNLEIPVCYASPYALDRQHICDTLGLDADALISGHTAPTYRVDLIGFTPGFAYLEGGNPRLDIPRLDTPRQRLPAGSIGITGKLCGLYALAGPGGWPIIGRTPMTLFDGKSRDPFQINTGMSITFTPISPAEFKAWVHK